MATPALQDQEFERIGEATLDDRQRLALTKALETLRSLYREAFQGDMKKIRFAIYCNRAGQILLSPETTIPLYEAWLYKDKTALARVLRGIEQAGHGDVGGAGSFARYAADDLD